MNCVTRSGLVAALVGALAVSLAWADAKEVGKEKVQELEEQIAGEQSRLDQVMDAARDVLERKNELEEAGETARKQLAEARQAIGVNEGAMRRIEQKLELELGEQYQIKALREQLREKEQALDLARDAALKTLHSSAEYQGLERRLEAARNASSSQAKSDDSGEPRDSIKSLRDQMEAMEERALKTDAGYSAALSERNAAQSAFDQANKELRQQIESNAEYQEHRQKADEARALMETAAATQKDAQKELRELQPKVNAFRGEIERLESSIARLQRRKAQIEKQYGVKSDKNKKKK